MRPTFNVWPSMLSSSLLLLIVTCSLHLIQCDGTAKTPVLVAAPQEAVRVIPGEEALIDCIVRDVGNYTVLWKHRLREPGVNVEKVLTANKVRLVDDKRISVLHNKDSDTWVLKIRQASPSDSGIYLCEVNTKPAQSVARIVIVEYPRAQNPLADASDSLPDVQHNYTECCRREEVPIPCLRFCHFKGLLTEMPAAPIAAICIHHMGPMLKCLTDGRNHLPCCQRQNIPSLCHPACVGNYTLKSVLDHSVCLSVARPILACIAEGIETLPPPPKDLTVDPLSTTQLQLKWSKPSTGGELIKHYVINVTELNSFDGLGKKKVVDKIAKQFAGGDALFKQSRTFTANKDATQFTLSDLKPFTMYEVVVISKNDFGTSVPTNRIRALTLSPSATPELPKPPERRNTSAVTTIPNVRKCCIEGGISEDRCLDALCDPTKAESISIADLTICSPYVNVTLRCLNSGVDVTDCCKERGVSQFCRLFCQGNVTRIDFRHVVCLKEVVAYSSCFLETHHVLPTEPLDFAVASAHYDWALMRWNPPAKLAETVVKYYVYWRETDSAESDGYTIEVAPRSPYLLDNLTPDTEYEVFVAAVNKYGASRGSSRVIFQTPTYPKADQIDLERSTSTYNETACCVRAALSESCLPLCSYHFKVSDALSLGPLCADSRTVQTLLRCTAGGRNHEPCCLRRGVSDACLSVCRGYIESSLISTAAKCAVHSGKILQCFHENSAVIPGIPLEVHATLVTKDSVHLKWNPSPEDTSKRLNYQVRYTKTDSMIPQHPLNHDMALNVTEPKAVVSGLEPGTRYSLYVTAFNEYGFSLPSLVLVLKTSTNDEMDSTHIKSRIGPPHNLQLVHQSVDSISFRWLPPLYLPPDASLSYMVHYREANDSDSLRRASDDPDEGWMKMETSSTLYDITNLNYNTEYAIGVKARTDSGLESALSELLLVRTDASIPATVNVPKIIPEGVSIVEGSNITVICDATGSPVPIVSILLNGQEVTRRELRQVIYNITNVNRNLTSVTCQATNSDPKTVHPAQSHLEIRVRHKPTARALSTSVKTPKYAQSKMQCEVSGSPIPKIRWYRDLKDQVPLMPSQNYQIVWTPHIKTPYTWVTTLLVKRSTESEAGNYICVAENEYGRASAQILLEIDTQPSHNRTTAACCEAEGVIPECRSACHAYIDFDQVFNKPTCFTELDKLMLCASDGSDHRDCCRRRNVDRECLHWCAGFKVSRPSLCLLSSGVRDILTCFQEGNALLPGPPLNLRVEKLEDENKLIVAWDPPRKNPESVQWYSVFWKAIGSKELDGDKTDKTSFELKNVDTSRMYEFLVKASNVHGTSALADPLVINYQEIKDAQSSQSLLGQVLVDFAIGFVALAALIGVACLAYKQRDAIRSAAGRVIPMRDSSANNGGGVSLAFENRGFMRDTVILQDSLSDPSRFATTTPSNGDADQQRQSQSNGTNGGPAVLQPSSMTNGAKPPPTNGDMRVF